MSSLDPVTADARIARLRSALLESGFEGDFEDGIGARHVAGTDNSIYQIIPAAIVYPRGGADVRRIVRAINDEADPLSLTARGGCTGTNGQSLNGGVIVDFARHMNRILQFDPIAGTVTVEPGVVLDQLNAMLAGHGLFFPPTVSTASRATIGGMVGTDASGKGSRRYGKTSDYIEALDVVLADGSEWRAEPMTRQHAEAIARVEGPIALMHREALRIATDHREEIDRVFPKMNRGLTGYNLQKLYQAESDRFFLGYLLAGSEGTLAVTRAITLRLLPKPKVKALAVARYASFDGALRDVERLLEADPVAIEILDDKVLGVARSDIIWSGVEQILGDSGDRPVLAMNFIEFADSDEAAVEGGLARLAALEGRAPDSLIDFRLVREAPVIARLWALREKCVGLLARLGGGRQGVPFVEDTAVPPEQLADYVAEFRALLDGYGLGYGMFGHADVGCLHVRPFLDMKDPRQAALIRPISDRVAALTRSYGGLLWGEHGRGFRGEYSPLFFGPELYPELVRIKQVFDPRNILNPGKLASSRANRPVDSIDSVPLRGDFDREIKPDYMAAFDRSVACNGNGACFSWDALDVMCPSYKATRDRAQSPKGRAALFREWARLSSQDDSPAEASDLALIEEALSRSLSTCLSCKACTTLCPVKVDIPAMKSRFLARHHVATPRPPRHRFMAELEGMLAMARRMPGLANAMAQSAPGRWLAGKLLGMVDLPHLSVPNARRLPPIADVAHLRGLAPERLARTIVLVEDSFTSSFDAAVVHAASEVLQLLGYGVYRVPPRANGKVLHLLGLRDRFADLAARRVEECAEIAETGARLVGVDPATTLMFEAEYREFCQSDVQVIGIERLLAEDIGGARLPAMWPEQPGEAYRLLSHCTEQALRPGASADWVKVLGHFGVRAQPVRTGCCGMAGLFGHEEEHVAMSRRLFDLSWRDAIGDAPDTVLATGFSCRCQTKRLTGNRPRHPLEILDDILSRHPFA